MRIICSFLLLLGFTSAFAQDDPPLDELGVESELVEEDYDDDEVDEEPPEPRQPPPPSNRFRNTSKRFGSNRSSGRSGRSGGGEDRLGKTEGKIKFELADPPKYYKKKNRPYLMPPRN